HLRGGTVSRNWTWESGVDSPLLAPEMLRLFMHFIDEPVSGQQQLERWRKNDSEAETRMVADMCSDLESLFGPKQQPLEANHRSEDKVLDEEMSHDLEAMLGSRTREEESVSLNTPSPKGSP